MTTEVPTRPRCCPRCRRNVRPVCDRCADELDGKSDALLGRIRSAQENIIVDAMAEGLRFAAAAFAAERALADQLAAALVAAGPAWNEGIVAEALRAYDRSRQAKEQA